MIIAHLAGGLGNQLFQYAMARQLCHRLGTELKLDLFSYRSDPYRRYALAPFAIHAEIARWRDVFRLCPLMALTRLAPRPIYDRSALWLRRVGIQTRCRAQIRESVVGRAIPLPLRHGRIVSERQLPLDPEVLATPDDSLVVGWWLHEGYFQNIRSLLLKEFDLRDPANAEDAVLLKRMQAQESVALHVRRGDKVGRATFKATSLEYCLRAIAAMKQQRPSAHFYVFSDEPAWTQQHLGGLPEVTLVTHNDGFAAHADLRLMRACKHQIIAASSLSWWAAWLNDHPDKTVISPPAAHWLQSPGYDTREILPKTWQVIEAAGD